MLFHTQPGSTKQINKQTALIKATCITTLTDARYFAARAVDYLGFNLEAGTRGYLDPIYMKAIREWVEGPRITGEFSRSSTADIREAALFYGLDAVQVAAAVHLEQLADLAGIEVLLWIDTGNITPAQAIGMLEYARPYISYAILDASTEGNLPLEWLTICQQFPVLLHTNGTAAETKVQMEMFQPAGLSISGGAEERTGVKSFEEIEEILDGLLEERK